MKRTPKVSLSPFPFTINQLFGDILFHVGRYSGLKGWVRGYGKKCEYLNSFIQGTFLLLLLARHSIRRYILHHIRTTIKAAKAHTEDQETSQPPPPLPFYGGWLCVRVRKKKKTMNQQSLPVLPPNPHFLPLSGLHPFSLFHTSKCIHPDSNSTKFIY